MWNQFYKPLTASAPVAAAFLTYQAIRIAFEVGPPVVEMIKNLPVAGDKVRQMVDLINSTEATTTTINHTNNLQTARGLVQRIPIVGKHIPGPLATLIDTQIYTKGLSGLPQNVANFKHHAGRFGRWILRQSDPQPSLLDGLRERVGSADPYQQDVGDFSNIDIGPGHFLDPNDPGFYDSVRRVACDLARNRIDEMSEVASLQAGILADAKARLAAKTKEQLLYTSGLDPTTVFGMMAIAVVCLAVGGGGYWFFYKKGALVKVALVTKVKEQLLMEQLQASEAMVASQDIALQKGALAMAKYELLGGKAVAALSGLESFTGVVTTYFIPGVCILTVFYILNKNRNSNRVAREPAYNPRSYTTVDGVDVEMDSEYLSLPSGSVDSKPAKTADKVMTQDETTIALLKANDAIKKLKDSIKVTATQKKESDAILAASEAAKAAKTEVARLARIAKRDSLGNTPKA